MKMKIDEEDLKNECKRESEYIWIGEIGWKESVGRDVRSGGRGGR
jgi:hypothetical protein